MKVTKYAIFLTLMLAVIVRSRNPIEWTHNHHPSDAGLLSVERDVLVCNTNLLRCGLALGMQRFMFVRPYIANKFCPLGYRNDLQHKTGCTISDKMVADVVESVMGAWFLDSGRCYRDVWEKVLVPFQIIPSGVTAAAYPSVASLRAHAASMQLDMSAKDLAKIRALERCIGYEFGVAVLALEALTHASYANEHRLCYQRLEFLGDAILGMIVTNRLFDLEPALSPGELSDWRSLAVGNAVLAKAAVRLELHNHMRHHSDALQDDIQAYTRAINRPTPVSSALGHEVGGCDSGCPKVLGDLVEALIGAVFVDSGGDWDRCAALVREMIWKPFIAEPLRRYGGRSYGPHRHPVSVLSEVVSQSGCHEGLEFARVELEEGCIRCELRFHGHVLASANGNNFKSAKKAAAAVLVKCDCDPNLTVLPLLLRHCDCQ